MKLRSGECKGWGQPCGKVGPLAKPSLGLCPSCNRKRLEAKRGPRPAAKPPAKKRHRTTGEAALFRAIWASRPHVCENCKAYLPEPARTFYFAHIKPKSTHPELRLDILNIRLLCFDCHTAQDHGTAEQYKARAC